MPVLFLSIMSVISNNKLYNGANSQKHDAWGYSYSI